MTAVNTQRTEANRQAISEAFDAWQHGTPSAVPDLFAGDLKWRIEGHSLVSAEYATKQQFVDEVLAPFAARFSAEDPFRPVRIRFVFADGDHVIVLWDGRGTASDGQPYENSYAWFMQMADGEIVEGAAFYDSISFNDLWNRVQVG
jgi:ketosteroid isomerase-like protein